MRYLPVALLWLAAALPLRAQEVLSWADCLAEAARNNPDLAAAQEAVTRAEAALAGSRSGFLPQISADAGYDRSDSDGSAGAKNDYSMGVSARQSLFSGLRDKAGVDRGRADLEAARAGLAAEEARVAADLQQSFARLLYAQEQVRLAETIAARRRDNLRLVGLRHEAGREHKGSFLRIKAAQGQADFEVSQAERALRVARRELARVLGRDSFTLLAATGSLTSAAPGDSPDFDLLARETPALRQAQARAAAARAGVTSARSGFFPDLSASADRSRNGSDWPPRSDRWSAGVSLSLPLFSGGSTAADLRGAKAADRQAREDLRAAAQQTALDLEDAFAGFQDAWERTAVQREFLRAAEVRAEIARSQYTSGLLSFEDWDIIENDLINNQKSWLASLRDAALAEAAWEQAWGKGLTQP